MEPLFHFRANFYAQGRRHAHFRLPQHRLCGDLPRFNKGDYLFSTDFGVKPVNGFSKCKNRLDTAMKEKLLPPAMLSRIGSAKH
jgi:hypothetical protein